MTQETPVRRKTRRRTLQGRQTREAILDGAVEVLATLGLAHFSIPQVAAAVGIAPGNLTYYFPTREDLIRAMTDRLLAQRAARFEDACARLAVHGDSGLEALVDTLIDDAVAPATVHAFPELWSLANQHDFVADSLERFHEAAVRAVLAALGANPDGVEAAPARACVRLLGCVAAGCTALYGRRARDRRLAAVRAQARMLLPAALRQALHAGRK